MKIDKKKITFAIIIGSVVIFIIAYSVMAFGGDEVEQHTLQQPLVPVLETAKEDYSSRLDAVDDLKEVRETNAPSIYDEKYLDSTGVFDPDLLEKKKIRMVDSIYRNSKINYTTGTYKKSTSLGDSAIQRITKKKKLPIKETTLKLPEIGTKEMALEQQLFFASNPLPNLEDGTTPFVEVAINKNQVIQTNDRLQIRTLKDVTINGHFIPRNTLLFGIVSFKPNRVLLTIDNIDNIPITLKAFDIHDDLEGVYVENSFREELKQQILGDVIDDINVPGVPQVTGLKNVFRRSNRRVKVKVYEHYRLRLKVATRN
ncbi:hypothetical protein MTsPCn5_38150 [Croceitalea sp. MTPC5]|uniref:conjugative transposon protein TraM n=1 Tax=Croceitalea sp. MTPC5 TaxID=3056565 RepID=UPI002B3DD8C7|nr:hypothetical protein MTsPCn5_38150 [Croceitalea sp. MTPC5]